MAHSSAAAKVLPSLSRVRTAERGVSRKEATRLFEIIARGAKAPVREIRSNIIPESSWKRAGDRLPPAATQSTLRLERVLQLAESIWGDKDAASAWLNTPHPELNRATPFSLLRTEAGGRAVEDLLIALEHGFPV